VESARDLRSRGTRGNHVYRWGCFETKVVGKLGGVEVDQALSDVLEGDSENQCLCITVQKKTRFLRVKGKGMQN